MDFIQRLALLFLFALPAFLPSTAFADYNKTLTRYKLNVYNTYYPTHTEACAYFVTVKRTAYPAENISLTNCTEVQVTASGYQAGYTYYSSGITKYGSCNGVESLWGNGICTGSCVAPQVLLANGSCGTPPPPPCVAGTVVYDEYTEKNFSNKIDCFANCEVYVAGTAPDLDCDFTSGGVGTCKYLYHTVFKQTGNTCTGDSDAPTPATPTPESCPQCECFESGGSWGQVGSINTCVPQGSTGSAPVQTTPPPKTTTTTPAPTPENPNPTPVTSETQPPVIVVTPAPAGSGAGSEPSITETTTNADGTTTTTTQSKGQYCAEKPTAEVCKGDGTGSKNSFGGNCNEDGTAEVSCDGDAIQCAIARQQKETDCKLFKPDQAMTDKFNEAKNDNGSTNPTNSANISTVHLPTALDASSPYSGQCIQDVTISVASSSVSLPFSAWCPYLEAIGYLFLACAYISAAFILGSAV